MFEGRIRRNVRTGLTQVLGLVLLAGLVALRLWDPAVVQTIRNQSFDLYQRIHPREYVPAPVVIVDVDEKSLAAFGQWPWPRTTLARLVDQVRASGSPAMAFDMVFSEPDRMSPDRIATSLPSLPAEVRAALEGMETTDARFAEAMGRFRVVLGQASVRNARDARDEKQELRQAPISFRGPPGLEGRYFLLPFPDIVRNRAEMREAAAGYGMFAARPDPDGVFRRVPLVMKVQEEPRLTLSAELLRVATGGDGAFVRFDAAGIRDVVVAGKPIPTDIYGVLWPWFTRHAPERFVSAADVLDGSALPALRGKLVLVGTSAVGLEDVRPTPMGEAMPGVEIHAQTLENMLTGTMLDRPPRVATVEVAIALVLGLIVIVLLPRLGARWSIAITGVLLVGYLGTSGYLFVAERLLLDPSFPFLSTLSVLIWTATGNYLREENDRKAIRSAFGQYVSPALVDQLADDPDRLSLGGETRELSVLFSDVRGFTAISETFKSDPQGLTELMNTFLNAMSQAILDEGGTIDKFMGDAVMAFWNAPLEKNDHAPASARAALAMIEAVRRLNVERGAFEDGAFEDGDVPPIDIGIGINTGTCIVGNMGSDRRFDYTALGDTVNISSRLEGQSKTYGVKIVLGDETAARVRHMAVLELDLIRVKGREAPERIHALLGDERVAGSGTFELVRLMNQDMLSAYRGRDWDGVFDAVAELREAEAEAPFGLDDYLMLYETRAAELRDNPPGTSWDGVYTATTK